MFFGVFWKGNKHKRQNKEKKLHLSVVWDGLGRQDLAHVPVPPDPAPGGHLYPGWLCGTLQHRSNSGALSVPWSNLACRFSRGLVGSKPNTQSLSKQSPKSEMTMDTWVTAYHCLFGLIHVKLHYPRTGSKWDFRACLQECNSDHLTQDC